MNDSEVNYMNVNANAIARIVWNYLDEVLEPNVGLEVQHYSIYPRDYINIFAKKCVRENGHSIEKRFCHQYTLDTIILSENLEKFCSSVWVDITNEIGL